MPAEVRVATTLQPRQGTGYPHALDTPLKEGDILSILPALAGGA